MKQNVFKILAVALLMVGFCVSANAKPYKYSLGVVAGMQIGPSAKFLLGKNHHFAMTLDLSYAYTYSAVGTGASLDMGDMLSELTPEQQEYAESAGWTDEDFAASGWGGGGSKTTSMGWEDFCSRLNMAYQGKAASGKGIDLDWYAGGGLSLGGMITHVEKSAGGKFGLNAIGGIEINMSNAPIAVDFDFRPGYAILFSAYGGAGAKLSVMHAFDWQLAFSIRYTF